MTNVLVRAVSLEQTRSLRQAVLRPHQTVEEMAEDESAEAFAVGALEGDELIAVRREEPGSWRIRGMATSPPARGRGAGTAVLRALLQHAAEAGAHRIWCNVRTPARSLYERAGLRVVSEEFEIPHIGPHVVMELRTSNGGPSRRRQIQSLVVKPRGEARNSTS